MEDISRSLGSHEETRKAPVAYGYLRRAASAYPGFQTGEMQRFEAVLEGSTDLSEVGSVLVGEFGGDTARGLANWVAKEAEQALEVNSRDKVASAAAKWARRTSSRIQGDKWVTPEEEKEGFQVDAQKSVQEERWDTEFGKFVEAAYQIKMRLQELERQGADEVARSNKRSRKYR